jgi:hypothetical protein
LGFGTITKRWVENVPTDAQPVVPGDAAR